MKIAILGAGAMGSLIGAHLAKGGADLVLVDPYEAHMKAIAEHGLEMTINGEKETVRMEAVTKAAEAGKADAVIVLVKGIFTDSAIEGAKELFDENTYVVTLQNGIGNDETLKKHFPADRILKGVIKITSQILEPGKIKSNILSDVTAIHLGCVKKTEAAEDRAVELVSCLKNGGLLAEYHDNIDDYIWSKAVNNVAINAACGVLRLSINDVCTHPEGLRIVESCVREVVAVANAKGISLNYDTVMDSIHKNTIPKFGEHLPSTAQDMVAGKPTEIELLNGAIVNYGKELGIPTPFNDAVCAFTRVIQDRYDRQVFRK